MRNRKSERDKKVQKRVRKRMKPCPLWGSSSAPSQIKSENPKKGRKTRWILPAFDKVGELT
jgi:hypothetical protein